MFFQYPNIFSTQNFFNAIFFYLTIFWWFFFIYVKFSFNEIFFKLIFHYTKLTIQKFPWSLIAKELQAQESFKFFYTFTKILILTSIMSIFFTFDTIPHSISKQFKKKKPTTKKKGIMRKKEISFTINHFLFLRSPFCYSSSSSVSSFATVLPECLTIFARTTMRHTHTWMKELKYCIPTAFFLIHERTNNSAG